jgi:hypothetical protein
MRPPPRRSWILETLIEPSYTGISFVFRDIPALIANLICSFLPASYSFLGFFWLLPASKLACPIGNPSILSLLASQCSLSSSHLQAKNGGGRRFRAVARGIGACGLSRRGAAQGCDESHTLVRPMIRHRNYEQHLSRDRWRMPSVNTAPFERSRLRGGRYACHNSGRCTAI